MKPLLAALLFGLLAAGCRSNQDQDTLKPPGVHVYRPPQVWVTHVPTEDLSAGPAYAETTTPGPPVAQASPMPMMSDEEYEQYMLDNIDYLLTRIENKLDGTDVNP